MTAELAAAIVDWRDADDEVSPGGAEAEYYLLLDPAYNCKNGPFESVEELLLVKGATPELLFGEDTNRNGLLDANENDASESDPPDNRDGHLDRGLWDYLTVYSREPNRDAEGEQRINVNNTGGDALSQALRDALGEDRFFTVMDAVRRGRPFRNLLDFRFKAGLTAEEFAAVADRLTTSGEETVAGLVNVNTAPREVLLCLPGLEEGDVDALIAHRTAANADLSSIAWVAEVLTREKAVEIGGVITTRSYAYSADIVAAARNGRAIRRYRAVVDASESPVRVLYWHQLSHLGWPLGDELFADLRAGQLTASPAGLTLNGSR